MVNALHGGNYITWWCEHALALRPAISITSGLGGFVCMCLCRCLLCMHIRVQVLCSAAEMFQHLEPPVGQCTD